MNEFEKETSNNAARGLASFSRGTGIPEADFRDGSNPPRETNAKTSGLRPISAPLPCLMEMGDIAPAMDLLLRVQAEYARKEPGVSRAMRDVAYNAVAVEIERYIRSR